MQPHCPQKEGRSPSGYYSRKRGRYGTTEHNIRRRNTAENGKTTSVFEHFREAALHAPRQMPCNAKFELGWRENAQNWPKMDLNR